MNSKRDFKQFYSKNVNRSMLTEEEEIDMNYIIDKQSST